MCATVKKSLCTGSTKNHLPARGQCWQIRWKRGKSSQAKPNTILASAEAFVCCHNFVTRHKYSFNTSQLSWQKHLQLMRNLLPFPRTTEQSSRRRCIVTDHSPLSCYHLSTRRHIPITRQFLDHLQPEFEIRFYKAFPPLSSCCQHRECCSPMWKKALQSFFTY